jgi:hypothetical protein
VPDRHQEVANRAQQTELDYFVGSEAEPRTTSACLTSASTEQLQRT